jgi:valyl-tRNA synthetase
VNPSDERYQALVGKLVDLPLTGRQIPILADAMVKPEFGTGAEKVTPAHDPNDYELAMRHNLEKINLFNDDATMNAAAGEEYVGLDRYECREAVLEDLEELGLIAKITDYEHEVGYSERGHVPVEPRISEQWFVRMQTLAEPALAAVTDGRIRFHPDRWTKTYQHWMTSIKDWCISRQLWWGHRIPAWYGPDGKIYVGRSEAEIRSRHGLAAAVPLRQDEDVLDTWFSSWLWPFSVFAWPQDNADLRHFYPTNTLVTGPDIIFFWVARMIMAGMEFMGEVPFKDVYFTSIIRDAQGRKLSKSLNNSPDPLDVIAEYGADALRYTMIYLAPIGTDIRYDNKQCELGRNFANKLWNAARFRQMQGELTPQWQELDGLAAADLRPDDRWMLARTDAAVRQITALLEQFDFHAYSLALYEFVWNQFCDWYVESAKSAFYGENAARKATTLRVFDYVYARILRLMHPVMPFVTEELYHGLGYVAEEDSLMLAQWPQPLSDAEQARLGLTPEYLALVEEKFSLIRAGRTLRTNYNIPTNKRIPYYLKPTDEAFAAMLAADLDAVRTLLNAESLTVDAAYNPQGTIPSAVEKHGLIYMPLAGLIDTAQEKARLTKQRDEVQKFIDSLDKKLANAGFVAKAPPEVVAKERERRGELVAKLEQVTALLRGLGA